MSSRLEGKVAFITGAARGQGRSHAVQMAAEGADIIALDICAPLPGVAYPSATEQDLEETARLVREQGRRIVTGIADVRNKAALQKIAEAGVDELGGLDVVVANAGISIVEAWDQTTETMWNDVISINLTGVWNTVMATAPILVERGGGSMILISSNCGLKALPFMVPYAAAKHGVTGLARAFALELAEHNVRVNSVHPAGVTTPMTEGGEIIAGIRAGLEKNPRLTGTVMNTMPVDRVDAQDVSHAVVFLASDESRYVTALAMTVDAGASQH